MRLLRVCLMLGFLCPVLYAQPLAFTADQKRRAEQLTSLFENDTLDLQYGYCAALGDGRGYTVGRAGFTTCTDEVYTVARAYTERRPGNPLVPFLPRLQTLADEQSVATSGLKGFPEAWRKAGEDRVFQVVQDEMVERLFWRPALQHAEVLGLRTPLGLAVLHDTIIQHGNDGDPDGLPTLVRETTEKVGGTPSTGVDEKEWVRAFLKIRERHLAHAYEAETREEWKKSLDRCLVFEAIAQAGNYSLNGPIVVKSRNHEAVIP